MGANARIVLPDTAGIDESKIDGLGKTGQRIFRRRAEREETALGEVTGGDDVIGFIRGFLYAGAESIVSSLWKVSDVATNQLMQAFYLGLPEQGKSAALRQAQSALKGGEYRHPYYWAAFQLTGQYD